MKAVLFAAYYYFYFTFYKVKVIFAAKSAMPV